jgi:integrase
VPRKPKPWQRAGRKGWWATIKGRQVMLGETLQEARDALDRLLRGLSPEIPGRVSEITGCISVASILRSWLDWRAGRVAPRSQYVVACYLVSAIDGPFGALPVREARPHHLAAWIGRPEWNHNTQRHAGRLILTAFRWAVAMGRIDRNPFEGTPLPGSTPRLTCPEPDEVAGFLGKLGPDERDYFESLWLTGARGGELARVTAADCDLAGGTITLTQHKTARKTGRPRVIYLAPRALAIVARLCGERPTGPIFLTPRGTPWTAHAAALRLKKHGMAWHRHSLRHAMATDLLCKGESVATVAALLGHASPTTTLAIYSHVGQRPDHLREALRKVRA